MGKIVAVANQKGGVGKTTTTINLAASLALGDSKVLAVDLDPQSNLTSGLGCKGVASEGRTVYEALMSDRFPQRDDFELDTSVTGLRLIPADRNLSGAEVELVGMQKRENRLKPLLRSARERYDYVFIDTPPSLGLLTLNALVAADSVLIPLTCEYLPLEGLAELHGTIKRIQAGLNPELEMEGVLLTMADSRTRLGREVAEEVRNMFKTKVYETSIPRNIRLGEAPSHGKPVILYDPKSSGAEAYTALAREIIAKGRPGSRKIRN